MFKTFEIPSAESCPGSMLGSPVAERHPMGSPRSEQMNLLTQYESGETGTLHHIFSDIMEQWLTYSCELGNFLPRTIRAEVLTATVDVP